MKLVHVIITYSLTVGVVSIMLPSTANAAFKWYSNSIIPELHFNTFNITISITLSTKNCLIEEIFLTIPKSFINLQPLFLHEFCDIIKNSFITFTVENPITFFYISRHISFFAFLIHAPGKSRIFLILIFSDYGCINRNCLSTIVAYCISFNRCNLR